MEMMRKLNSAVDNGGETGGRTRLCVRYCAVAHWAYGRNAGQACVIDSGDLNKYRVYGERRAA